MTCYCEKLGGKIGWFGTCGDEQKVKEPYYSIPIEVSSRFKHKRRRELNKKHKDNLKWKYEYYNGYPMPCWPVDENGKWTDKKEDIVYYKRFYKSAHSGIYRYYKRSCNRSVRRYCKIDAKRLDEENLSALDKKTLSKEKGLFKKIAEYAWMVD